MASATTGLDRILFGRTPDGGGVPDIASRRRLLDEPDTSFFVEAGAGSGKTACMSARLVALIVGGKAACGEIAAVTFTRKAAAEMRQRFQDYLETVAKHDAAPAPWRAAAGKALGEIDRAFVGTIHSFCARMLRERPIESGLPPDFRELEEEQDAAERTKAWEEYSLGVPVAQPALVREIRERDLGLTDMANAYDLVCLYPEITFPDCAAGKIDAAATAAGTVAIIDAIVRATGDRSLMVDAGAALMDAEMRWLLDARAYLARRPTLLWRLLGRIRKKVTADGFCPVHKGKEKKAGEAAAGIREAFDVMKEFLSPGGAGGAFVDAYDAWRYQTAIKVATDAAAHYLRRREETGMVNFADLLLKTRNLLRDNDEVRADLAQRYRRVLVDEFQDTDPLQAEILAFLCADRPASGARWQDRRLRTGALMVVGDPKQSIYRFRRADIEVFNAVREMFTTSKGAAVITLKASFRSVPPISDFVNAASKGFFPAHGTRFQAAFEEMKPVMVGGGGPAVMTCTYQGPCGNKDLANAKHDNARKVVRFLLACREGKVGPNNVRWGDILVLTMLTGELGTLAREMNAAGIPVEVTGAGDLGTSLAAGALVQALGVIADPDDPVGLVALLRGPLFGISDRELYEYRAERDGRRALFSFYADLPEGLDRGLAKRLGGFFETLKRLRVAARRLPPAAVIERAIDDLGIRRLAIASATQSQDLGGLEKAVEMARGYANEGFCSLDDVVGYLRSVMGGGADSISLQPGRRDAVRLMNLHKAKGLEGRVVVLAGPFSKMPERTPNVIVDRDRDEGWVQVNRPKGEHGREPVASPPGWAGLCVSEREHVAAEGARLQYVAATRAKELLVVCRAVNQKGETIKSNAWFPLLGALGGAGVEIAEFDPVPAPRPETPRVLPFARTGELVGRAGVRSYEVVEVSSLTGKGASGKGRSRGPEYGTAMHAILQAMLDRNAEPAVDLARNALTEASERDPDPATVAELADEATRVAASALWARIKRADARFTEVPMGLASGQLHIGRADVVFRDGAGWVLVDFKSDDPAGRTPSLKATYLPQIDMYAEIWKTVTGEPIAERHLLFTMTGEAEKI